MRGLLDKLVRLLTPEVLCRDGGDVLREQQSSGGVQVLQHPLGIDFQSFGYLPDRSSSPATEGEDVRESLPLGVPRARGPLVLAHHSSLQRMREVEYPSGVRGGGHGEEGVSLVGRCRRASPSLSRGLGDLPYLCLGHRDDDRWGLAKHARDGREGAPDIRDPDPVRVPPNYGLQEVNLPRELAEDLRARRS